MIREWLDNPLFVKHVRSRLRPQGLASSAAIVILLCLCVLYGAFQTSSFLSGGGFTALMVLQFLILVMMGSTQVGASVGAARSSGVLDFHRVSPQTPLELSLGFLFGAPVREYLLTALTVPFALLCSLFGYPDLRNLLQMEILLLATACTIHAIALLSGLVMKGPGGQNALGLSIVLGVFVATPLFGAFYQLNRYLDQDVRMDFFVASIPWLPFVLLHIGALLFFLLLGTTHKMESARRHGLSKLQALAAMGTLAALAVGGRTNWGPTGTSALVLLYALVAAGVILAALITPSLLDHVTGLRRARKEGLVAPSVWSANAPNRTALFGLCAVILATGSILGRGWIEPFNTSRLPTSSGYPLAVAVGVLSVAYFGLASQYFLLRFGRRGPSFFGLFLFVAWGLPMILGVVALASMAPGQTAEVSAMLIFSASPIVGLASASGFLDQQAGSGPAMVAITCALLYAFVFQMLYTKAVRRVRRGVELLDAPKEADGGPDADPDFQDAAAKPAAATA